MNIETVMIGNRQAKEDTKIDRITIGTTSDKKRLSLWSKHKKWD